ncbi:hypothetical protein HanPSC8_Chr12g0543371 [Helianthus annuus]|nr:hypothetical protein HanPSC8_Chr12g0543371 [Helianthus annuus]
MIAYLCNWIKSLSISIYNTIKRRSDVQKCNFTSCITLEVAYTTLCKQKK